MEQLVRPIMQGFVEAPAPPYVAVIFSFRRRAEGIGDPAYTAMVRAIVEHAQGDPAYLGFEHAEGRDGFGLVIHYLRDAESATRFQHEVDALVATIGGRRRWFSDYIIRHAAVLRDAMSSTEVDGERPALLGPEPAPDLPSC